jgi:hypothetical protein
MSGNTWNKFVKAYAEEYKITYAAALKEARTPYQQWKQENEGKLQQEKPVRVPRKKPVTAKKPSKKSNIISSDSESEEEAPRPVKKKRSVKKRDAPRRKRYVMSSSEDSDLSMDSDSDEYVYVKKPRKKTLSKSKYYFE